MTTVPYGVPRSETLKRSSCNSYTVHTRHLLPRNTSTGVLRKLNIRVFAHFQQAIGTRDNLSKQYLRLATAKFSHAPYQVREIRMVNLGIYTCLLLI